MIEEDFKSLVISLVKDIPFGNVSNYGHIAFLAGKPNNARQVGYILSGVGVDNTDVPWWRVVNSKGEISIRKNLLGVEKQIQRSLLISEGVQFKNNRVERRYFLSTL